ncbi:MAG TPA: energy transducer TonB [Crocinitomicaceae bacterium]|nr:energy transducer TonB [Crocinitomicaceae bacterium]
MGTPLEIKNPCSENWETMKIGLNSRFCDSCQKNVIDFTTKSREEILEYLLTRQNERVCGRIYRSQLDFSNTDFLVTIQALAEKHKNTNLSFYLLTVGTMILASCNTNVTDQQHLPKTNTEIVQSDTTENQNITSKDTTKCVKDTNDFTDIVMGKMVIDPTIELPEAPPPPPIPTKSPIPPPIVVGEIIVPRPNEKNEPYFVVDVMPEFKGGIDSLRQFLTRNLKYPEWEHENKIEGTVVVRLVIDKNGKVKNPRIIKSVQGAKNFNAEVLRIVSEMPDWIPAKNAKENVDAYFTLPVRFSLSE